jgi:hypothetical protein
MEIWNQLESTVEKFYSEKHAKHNKILLQLLACLHYTGWLSVALRKSTYPIRNVQLSEAEQNNISLLQQFLWK